MLLVANKNNTRKFFYSEKPSLSFMLLPSLFSRSLQIGKQKIIDFREFSENGQLKLEATHKPTSEHTRQYMISHLKRYFEWIEEATHIPDAEVSEYFTLSNHSKFTSEVMEYYLNNYGIEVLGWSISNSKQAHLTLTYYYNWLHYCFPKEIPYRRIRLNDLSAKKNDKVKKVPKYLSKDLRRNLCDATDNLAYKLAIRCGSEIGLRTAELRGLLIEDRATGLHNDNVFDGLKSLFKQYDIEEAKLERNELDYVDNEYTKFFEFELSGLYTKYGSSRKLLIPRSLLRDMKKYFNSDDRPKFKPQDKNDKEGLFLNQSKGERYGMNQQDYWGTYVFRTLKEKLLNNSSLNDVQAIQKLNSFHHLRHSFGTDLFYTECLNQKQNYEFIHPESSVMRYVSERMGHSLSHKGASAVTEFYIHLVRNNLNYLSEGEA